MIIPEIEGVFEIHKTMNASFLIVIVKFYFFFVFKDELQYTLEKKYITGQKSYLFTRESHKFKYRISFDDWEQKNLDTLKVRKMLRRPIFVSRSDIVSKQL